MSQKKAKLRRRERREIQFALAEQLRLLAKRCRDFDEGDWGEAVGIAARLRVILNRGSKKKSPSLLQSLGAEKVPLLSTREPIQEDALWAVGGLYRQTFGKDEEGVYYRLWAPLEDASHKAELPAHRWWEQIVGIEEDGSNRLVFSRKSVIRGCE
jgi:hypothetical protein